MRVLMKADPSSRESLQTEAEVDPMDGEQTWPTESELLEAEGGKRRQRFENDNSGEIRIPGCSV